MYGCVVLSPWWVSKSFLSCCLRRAVLLSEFEIIYFPQKAVKGQALADFLAAHPVPADSPLSEDFPDEEVMMTEYKHPLEMYFDGASREDGAGAGVVFVSPERSILPHSYVLTVAFSNNEAEYEALIIASGWNSHAICKSSPYTFMEIPSSSYDRSREYMK